MHTYRRPGQHTRAVAALRSGHHTVQAALAEAARVLADRHAGQLGDRARGGGVGRDGCAVMRTGAPIRVTPPRLAGG